ncbi:hypothetical protein [Nocardioides acrostichi]|uniref:Uncharacterized protein n=1 Tax=Nocardioides acrostichi TaxID=2784339 RepID=A0A930V203_9ACTN|nr:hypothetical protein [Nocardioides acrostichi]MBF4161749.1 hypothetical protein [Nocardioides acrostichi]
MGRLAGSRRVTVRSAALAAAVLALSGCSSLEPPEQPTTGIDELVIPTPAPDPTDFVAGIDNPWLAWEPGARFDLDDVTLEVGTGAVEVDGVATTPVTIRAPAGSGLPTGTDYLAQDDAGNVWWFGRRGHWLAGRGDAEPGLWLAADPRRGDGWQTGARDDAGQPLVATVLTDVGTVESGAGAVSDAAVVVQLSSTPAVRLFYTRGVGLSAVVDGARTDHLQQVTTGG